METPVRILLVDDDSEDRAMLTRLLQRTLLRVHITPILEAEAWRRALAQTDDWDLAIVEHRLPWSDGLALVRAVKDAHSARPVIMCTRHEHTETAVAGMKAGLTDYILKKPTELARLPQVVRASVAQLRQQAAARAGEARYRNLFEGMLMGLYQIDPDGRMLDVNPAMLNLTGYERREELLAQDMLDMFADKDERSRWIESMMRDRVVPTYEMKLRRRDGSIIWVENNARAIVDSDGRTLYFEGSLENITERKWTEERLNVLAHYDSLTGLPNRLLFAQRLQQAMNDASHREVLVGVVFIDLDRFKYINDTLGHDAGDVVLKAVAARLTACVHEGNTIARLSGDEFGIILSDVAHVDDITKTAENILEIFSQPFYVGQRELFITPSLGLTVYPFDEESQAEGLLKNAEIAMYGAKERGRNNYQYYSVDMTATVSRHLILEHAMRRALDRGEFLLHYQPQIDTTSGKTVGMEALVRWRHPKYDLMSPSEFIPLAEETGLILPLGEWALRTACAQNRAWQNAGFVPVRVAVNLSARQFQQAALLDMIRRVLKETGLEPSSLELEITESVLMQNTESTIATLQDLHAMGVHLSIDDFGTGYSSLSYLKRFPIDSLKIDQSFVRDIPRDADDSAIATAIIAMAHSLGVKVIAEGVENENQLAFLRAQHCDTMQGFYFGKPLPAEDVVSVRRYA